MAYLAGSRITVIAVVVCTLNACQVTVMSPEAPPTLSVPSTPAPIISRVAEYEVPAAPRGFSFAANGSVWMVCDNVTVELTQEGILRERFPGSDAGILHVFAGDELWVNHNGGYVERLTHDGEVAQRFTPPHGAGDWFQVPFTVDREGGAWFFCRTRTCKYAADGTKLLDVPVAGQLHLDRDGQVLVIGDRMTTLALDGSIVRSVALEQFLNLRVSYVDQANNVWGTKTRSPYDIVRVRPEGTATYFPTTSSNVGGAHPEADGSIWYYDLGAVHKLSAKGKLLGSFQCDESPTAIAFNGNGTVWISYSKQAGERHYGMVVKYALN